MPYGPDAEGAGSDAGAQRDWIGVAVRAAIRRPHATLAFWVAWLGLACVGVARLEIDTSTASFLDRGDPAWQVYQESVETFGGDEFIAIGLAGETRFDRDILASLRQLSAQLERVPGVRRVDSLASVPLIRGDPFGDGLRVDSILSDGLPSNEAGWSQLIEAIRGDRVAPGGLVSADERVFTLNVSLDRNVDADRAGTVAAVRKILAGRNALVSGVPVFRTEVNARTRSELALFVPLTLAVVGFVLILAFRSFVAVLIPIAIGGVGSATALGCMGALGVSLSLSTLVLPSVLLALGCAYTMHVLAAARRATPGRDGLEAAMRAVAIPVALSGLTTVIGFLAMATVRIAAIRELATYGAVGVFAITAAVLTLAPAILTLRPMTGVAGTLDARIRGPLRLYLVSFLIRRRRSVIVAWAVVLLVVGVGIARLDVSTDIILWFPESTDVRSDYEEIRRRLSGITPVNVVIASTTGERVTTPSSLAAIDALSSALDALPEVGKAISVADPLRQLNRQFTGDADAGLPSDEGLIEQYLVLLEGVPYLADLISLDHSAANILLRVDDNASDEIVGLSEWVAAWWREHGAPGVKATTTGIMYEFGRAEEQIAYGQIRGLGLAFAAIALILLAVLRRPGLALTALLPNAVPLAIGFGFMGLVGIALDAATVCMGSLALGIAVDDTIHVATGYRDALERGSKPVEALDRCFERVLPPLVFTTVAIAAGFAVLGLSEFSLIRNLGLVTSALVGLCLLADVTLLPALLLRGDRR